MMASVSMENREIAVGFHSGDSRQYAVWDWARKSQAQPCAHELTEYARSHRNALKHTLPCFTHCIAICGGKRINTKIPQEGSVKDGCP